MSLDKKRQRDLLDWLKQQAKYHKKQLRYSVFVGLIYAVMMIIQAGLLAEILHKIIIEHAAFEHVLGWMMLLLISFILRALLIYAREKINFSIGANVRSQIRQKLLNQFEKLGPAYLNYQTTGAWSALLIEQVDNLQHFYGRYLPQMRLAVMVPLLIFIVILPLNWAAAIILLCAAPLIPIFMILVGMGAADVNRRNFKALAHLSGHFLDRLKGLDTIRLFYQGKRQSAEIEYAAENFRHRTMQVLKMAFLSSGVLEFFASISIAVVAVYFGFSYLGQFEFGSYDTAVTLFAGFFVLILAPEFFQPLRDLGTYYHDKAEAIAAADTITGFLNQTNPFDNTPMPVELSESIQTIYAKDLIVLSTDLVPLVGPISFHFTAPFNIALVGVSGEGKSSLFNVLLGFLPYKGTLEINGIEFRKLNMDSWRKKISWIGQSPYLINADIEQNIVLGNPSASNDELKKVMEQAQLSETIAMLPLGIHTIVGEDAVRLSVGQAQRIAIARALLKPCELLLLDEPTANLDKQTAENILISKGIANSITITHQHETNLAKYDAVWRLDNHVMTVLKNDIKNT